MEGDLKEDFESVIRAKGLEPDDFDVTEVSKHEKGVNHTVTGSIIVKRLSNGIEKTYKSGHGSTWPTHFSDDLYSGLFD